MHTVALGATIGHGDNVTGRTFKTAWFAKAARKVHITDKELCEAIEEVMLGQADDLGGGVFKKRLNSNMHRSIILAKGERYWIYQYLFAKSDRENIDDDELVEFRKLAKVYEKLTADKVKELMDDGELTEICNGNKTKV
ncbi:MAG: type II toxin-antitoxin system RelE/ParE family toxin [Sulfuritalea sp.]|nr:type II toxin-antitoxin system RelE/ParE family toxin [Sulfuritalea sp.]